MSTSTARRWALRGTATAVAVVVAAGTIAAAHTIGTTETPGDPAGRTVTPVPAAAERVCAGSALRLSDDAGNDATRASAVGSPEIASATTGEGVDRTQLEGSSTGGSEPTLLTAPAGDTAPQVAGSSVQSVSDGDLVGTGAASCEDPSQSTWLVGGSTETGRTSLVTLANPTDVNATVDLAIADAEGTVSAPGTTGIVVAPNSQKVVPLSGFVTDQASTVVHVTSTGGQIVAHMQESVVRTLTPGGFDIVSGGAAPARTQVIPGVVLDDAEGAQRGEDTADAAPALRLYVPGDRAARVTLGITTADGGGTTVDATAEPGIVTDVPLDDFPDGRYSFTITSTVPIVAGARTTTPTEDGRSDLGWFASAEPLGASTITAVAAGSGARLNLVNPTREDATVTIASGEDSQEVEVASGSTATVSVPSTQQLTITGAEGLVAGVTYQGDDGIAGFPIRPATEVSSPLRVYP
jgi:P pilus assembly chaperone PapD